MKTFIKRLFGIRERVVVWGMEPLTETQLRERLLWTGIEDAKMRAVLQILKQHIDRRMLDAAEPAIAERPMAQNYELGGVNALVEFMAELQQRMDGTKQESDQ